MKGKHIRVFIWLVIITLTAGSNEVNKKTSGAKLKLSDLLKAPKNYVQGSDLGAWEKAVLEDEVEEDVDLFTDSGITSPTHEHTHHPPGSTDHPPGSTYHPPGHTHHPPGHGTTHDPGHGGGGHSMKMYFHVSNHATILFENWQTMTAGDMAGSCIGLAIIAILYEGFKVLREHLMTVALTKNSVTEKAGLTATRKGLWIGSGWHVLQSFLHLIQSFLSYCLMLVFMTYNAWLCIAVLLGMMFGYFFFGWMKSNNSADSNEDCS